MPTITDWIMATASAVSALGFILLCFQTFYLKKQLEYLKEQISKDNERARSEKAIEMIELWNRVYKRETSAVRKIVEAFDDEKARLLFNGEQINIPSSQKSSVDISLKKSGLTVVVDQDSKTIKLDEPAVAIIRYQATAFLNIFECIALAWQHNVADRKMIEQEFSSFVDEQKGFTILETFRNVNGGINTYPAILAFVYAIREARGRNIPPSKGPL